MPFEIRTPDGHILYVHTEVGNGLTQVHIEAAEPEQEQASIEQTGADE